MLRSYTNQDDIVIGTPVANRHYNQIQNLIGFFVNSLPIRININNKSNLTDFIKQLSNHIIDAQLHQDLPFEKLVNILNVEKDTSRHPIFQIMFGVQSFGNNSKQDYNDNILLPYDKDATKYNIAKFDIETFIDDSDEILRGSFGYRVSLYKEDTIKRCIYTYIHILQQVSQVSNNKELALSNITYLSKREEDLILKEWNNTDKSYPSDKTIHSLFEEQVIKAPNNIAVVYEDIKLTYKELNKRANQLAHYLIKHHNIKPDSLITLLLDRSEHIIIAILAVLKAGAAYVPMDPNYPDDRIKYILDNTNTNIVITNNIYNSRINKLSKINAIPIDNDAFSKTLNILPSANPIVNNLTSNNLAYVIYTSGTTGNPKGVLIEHKNTISLITANYININPNDTGILLSDIAFDATVFEIWTQLLNALTLFIPKNVLKLTSNVKEVTNIFKKYNITILWFN